MKSLGLSALNVPRAVIGVGLALGLGAAALGLATAAAAVGVAGYVVASPVLLGRWAVRKYLGQEKKVGAPAERAAAPTDAGKPDHAAGRAKTNMRVQREVDAEARFRVANKRMIETLGTVPDPSRLGEPEAWDRVIKKLGVHGRGNGVTEDELREWVAAGERITRALEHQQPGAKLEIPDAAGGTVEIKPCVYTARALAWFVAAQTARQDVERENLGNVGGISDLTMSGSSVMKDPGNRIYNFLMAAPTCAPRMSTHFADRQDGGRMHWIGWWIPAFTKKEQHGIEDYCSKMPGPGGTLLFEKLRPSGQSGDPELFVKFESAGCPPYFFAHEPHHTWTDRILQLKHAFARNKHHAHSFEKSTKAEPAEVAPQNTVTPPDGAGSPGLVEVAHQEHVYKGYLKKIADTFRNVIAESARLDRLPLKRSDSPYSEKELMSGLKKRGLPFVKSILGQMQEQLEFRPQEDDEADKLSKEVNALLNTIKEAEAILGAVSHRHGIERRGAETHLSLYYDWNHPE